MQVTSRGTTSCDTAVVRVPEEFYAELELLDRFLLANFSMLIEDIPVARLHEVLHDTELSCDQCVGCTVGTSEVRNFFNQHVSLSTPTSSRNQQIALLDGREKPMPTSSCVVVHRDYHPPFGAVMQSGMHVSKVKTKTMGKANKPVVQEWAAKDFVEKILPAMAPSSTARKSSEQEQKWVVLCHTKIQGLREELYAGRKSPVLAEKFCNIADRLHEDRKRSKRAVELQPEQDHDNSRPVQHFIDTSPIRREFVIERQAQIQATHEFEEMQEQLHKYDTLADVGECKKIWLRWVSELSRKIERIRFEPTVEEQKTVLSAKVPSYLPSDLLAVTTCRTAFSVLYQPRKNKDKDALTDIIGQQQNNFNNSSALTEEEADLKQINESVAAAARKKNQNSGISPDQLYSSFSDSGPNKEAKVGGCKVKVVTQSRDVLAVPFADICSKIGDAINFEYNCYRVNQTKKTGLLTSNATSNNSAEDEEVEGDVDHTTGAMGAGTTTNPPAVSEEDTKHMRKLRNAAAAEQQNRAVFASIDAEDLQEQELKQVQDDFAKETKLTQRKLYYEKIKMLEDPVWDRYTVRVPLGAELCHLLLECCPVECDYEDAKHLLSAEQQQAWEQKKRDGKMDEKGTETTRGGGGGGVAGASGGAPSSFQQSDRELGLASSSAGGVTSGTFDEAGANNREALVPYDEMHHSSDNFDRVEINALYHRLIWQSQNKMQGQIVMREICRQQLEEANFPQTIRPVNPPMICKPLPWLGPRKGCYYLHSVRLIRPTGSQKTMDDAKVYDMTKVQKAMDVLSQVAWRVNKKVFDVMSEVWEKDLQLAKIPPRENVPLSELFKSAEQLKGMGPEALKLHLLQIQQAKRKNAQLVSERPTFLLRLNAAREYYFADQVFFPHSIDFRGRAYPIPPHWNHQGPDVCRGLLEFAEAKRLGERGWYWLKIATANLYGKDKLSLEKRVEWAEENMDRICKTARDPFADEEAVQFWSTAADGAWQFLAKCFEVEAARSCPEGPTNYLSHTPVFQDGSCNGLQHYAALGRDKRGGAAVNLLPSEVPQDVYTIVLEECIHRVNADTHNNEQAQLCVQHEVLKRSTVKQTVMTICYGVTILGATEQVRGKLRDLLGSKVDEATLRKMAQYLARRILQSVDQVFDRAMRIKKWFDAVSVVFSDVNLPCCWMTPFGLSVSQPYYVQSKQTVRTGLQSVTLCNDSSSEVDGRHQKCGFPPNYVHSLDAAHMMMVATKMHEANMDFAMVHDSFWTHACNVDFMNFHIRDSFIELHNQPLLQDLERDYCLMLGAMRDRLPVLPPREEDLDLEKVRESLYFFD
ncbi:unnamed protein product [Amoebophrya sp. A120]|nr:unnamed protein product [Amoebophrya sp. A120]|eukprot:GSA120T00013016001.1